MTCTRPEAEHAQTADFWSRAAPAGLYIFYKELQLGTLPVRLNDISSFGRPTWSSAQAAEHEPQKMKLADISSSIF